MKKRFLTLLLTVVLAVSCITPAVYAGTDNNAATQNNVTADNVGKVEVYNGSYAYVNPLYADTVDVSDLKYSYSAPVVYSDGQEDLEEYYCSSIEEAGYEMRDNIVAREEVIEVKYKNETYDETQFKNDMRTIVDYAMEHTGISNEGDYLKWQYGGWTASMSGSSDGTYYYFTITYTFTYYTTAAQEEEMTTAVYSAIDSITAEKGYNICNASDYLKISAIYDYLCENITYDYDNLEDDTYKLKHTAYAALINKTAVCQGYAVLFYRMALELGVDSRVITGIGNGGGHAWNIVELHDKYYNLDSTWDAPRKVAKYPYEYFLKCTANFGDHTRDAEYDTEDFNTAYPMGDTDYVTVEEDSWENIADALADIKSMQLSLSDKISVKFLVDVDEAVVSGASNGTTEDDYMIVSVGDNIFYEIYVSDTTTQTSSTGEECRVFEVELNSKQMTDLIVIEMIVDAYPGEVVQTSVSEYGNTILEDTTGAYTDADKDMVRAMLNYGGYAQVYFDGATEGLANEGLYTSETDPVANWGDVDMNTYKHTLTTAADTKGITANSATLVLESQTELRFYFNLDEGKTLEDYVFELGDTTKTLQTGYHATKGMYYVAVSDIGPAALQNMYTLTVTAQDSSEELITINYGAMSYARTAINSSTTSEALKNLVKALYLYNQAALNY